MLKEFKDYAIKVLEETNTNYKIKKVITEDNRHIGDRLFVKELPKQLESIGYYLSIRKNKKGYYFICQPTIDYDQGECYGNIPEDLLQQITNKNLLEFSINTRNNINEFGEENYKRDPSFIYKEAPVNFNTWMSQMVKVYGNEKANIAISFSIASLFRDTILDSRSFFPHLFLVGEKASGKSKFGDSIHNLFTYKLAPFDSNSGTLVDFYRRLARLKNVPTFFEEYHDKIDDKMFQAIKGAYDNRGRKIGRIADDGRTHVLKANCSIILAGQYLSSRDDNSISSRSITEMFIKKDSYDDSEIEDYNTLKKWEKGGLSSLLLEVLQHRNHVEQKFCKIFDESEKRMKKTLFNKEYEARILGNYNVLYACVVVLYDLFEFPFTLEEFYAQCIDGIVNDYNSTRNA